MINKFLILAGCVLSCGVACAAESGWEMESISVEAIPSQLQEGMNLLSTAPSGYQLYAQVAQGVVTHYIIKDSTDAIVPCTQMRDQEHTKICVEGDEALCWEISEIDSYTALN